MCIEKGKPYTVPKSGRAWKVFRNNWNGRQKGLTACFSAPLHYDFMAPKVKAAVEKRRRRGVWLKAKNYAPDKKNCPGWHLLPTKREAKDWQSETERCSTLYYPLERVQYRGRRECGYHAGQRVFAADEILILPEKQ